MNVHEVKQQLKDLEVEVNSLSDSGFRIEFKQQQEKPENMSFTGGNGRIYVQPSAIGYDISLSGKSLEEEMLPFMVRLCGRQCDGYKQPNEKKGKKDQPYWRVDDFALVKKAVYEYAGKSKSPKGFIETPAPQKMSEAPLNEENETIVPVLIANEQSASPVLERDFIDPVLIVDSVARKVELTGSGYVRDQRIAAYAKQHAHGVCDLCKQEAPFHSPDGEPYLESHHVVWLSRGGRESISNVVALCPNCHRKMHIRNDDDDRDVLIRRITDRDAQ